MSICNKIKFNNDRVCVGDLRFKISLYTRSIVAPNMLANQSTEFTEDFTLLGNFWSAIKIVDGIKLFDNISLDKDSPTHLFYIRYKQGITQENWLNYNNYRYNILKVENMNERNKFLKLYCAVSGEGTKDGSKL
tara:strand:- start:354 stop:755 length:402 start_codon:yes stop_codon:yes gene_type:complete